MMNKASLLRSYISRQPNIVFVRLYICIYIYIFSCLTRLLFCYSARLVLYLFSTYALQPSRLIVPSGLEVLTFATRRLHACHDARAPSGGRWNCGQEMSGKFCLNADFRVTFRYLLHAVKLRHGTDGFTSPPKGGVPRIFYALKIRRLLPWCEPAELLYQRPALYL
jgi:hypothetical protein